jgi:hypothetical protein
MQEGGDLNRGFAQKRWKQLGGYFALHVSFAHIIPTSGILVRRRNMKEKQKSPFRLFSYLLRAPWVGQLLSYRL